MRYGLQGSAKNGTNSVGAKEQVAGQLGTYGNRPTPPTSQRRDGRASRHALKSSQRRLTESVSARFCWFAVGDLVQVDLGASAVAHVSGVARCGSPWSCPVCAPIVRERRAQEIDSALAIHLSRGGGCEFVTLTLQHHLQHSLSSRLDVITQSQNLVASGSPWAKRKKRLGFLGGIKAVEITWGESNGWHPHSHTLWLFERPLSDLEREDLRTWLLGRWQAVSERRRLGVVHPVHGVDVRPVAAAGDLGQYLTKVEGGWSAGLELTRTDLKRSSPIGLLRNLVLTGESRMAALWCEYERGTFGKRAVVWSPGLRGLLLGDEQEASDVELAASEGADLTLLRAWFKAADWNKRDHAQVLDDVEDVALFLLLVADLRGQVLQPLDMTTMTTTMTKVTENIG